MGLDFFVYITRLSCFPPSFPSFMHQFHALAPSTGQMTVYLYISLFIYSLFMRFIFSKSKTRPQCFFIYESVHDKIYNKTYASQDSDQPVHCGLIRFFAHCMCLLQPLGYPKRDKREPFPYWVVVQADLSLCWSPGCYCKFCHVLAHIYLMLLLICFLQTYIHLGPVVQSIVSLMNSLRVISLTVLADSIHNILIFFAEKM